MDDFLLSALRRALIKLENPVYGGVYIGLVGLSLVLYFTTCYTNPGYVFISKYKQVGLLLRLFLSLLNPLPDDKF